jgi:hypothetical protein
LQAVRGSIAGVADDRNGFGDLLILNQIME